VGLIAGYALIWSGYIVRPRGLLDWGLVLGVGAIYILLANWLVRQLRRSSLFSRMRWYGRLALTVPILSLMLLLTAYVLLAILGVNDNT